MTKLEAKQYSIETTKAIAGVETLLNVKYSHFDNRNRVYIFSFKHNEDIEHIELSRVAMLFILKSNNIII